MGAGISLWKNALRVLFALGLRDSVEKVSSEVLYAEFVSPDGRELSSYELDDLLDHDDDIPAARLIHRGELLNCLAEGIDSSRVSTGMRCVHVDCEREHPTAVFEDGTEVSASVIVGPTVSGPTCVPRSGALMSPITAASTAFGASHMA